MAVTDQSIREIIMNGPNWTFGKCNEINQLLINCNIKAKANEHALDNKDVSIRKVGKVQSGNFYDCEMIYQHHQQS